MLDNNKRLWRTTLRFESFLKYFILKYNRLWDSFFSYIPKNTCTFNFVWVDLLVENLQNATDVFDNFHQKLHVQNWLLFYFFFLLLFLLYSIASKVCILSKENSRRRLRNEKWSCGLRGGKAWEQRLIYNKIMIKKSLNWSNTK